MDVEINWLAVLLAALSTMVVGSVWYTPKVFGNKWIEWAKIDRKHMADPKVAITLTVIVSFISAYVLAHVTYISNSFFGNSFLRDSLMTAFLVWLGFTAARFVTHDAFENRNRKLTILNVSHELVTFLVMGLIIGLLPPAQTAGINTTNVCKNSANSSICTLEE